VLEFYPFLEGGNNSLRVFLPFGENADQFKDLSGLPDPEIKQYQQPGIIGDFNYIFFP